METNVNNLNGVPNFGHGLPEDIPVEDINAAVDTPEETKEVVVELPENNIE